jgi:cyclophilin family peptidyl-prolyl cis-trans isomerase
MVFQLFENSTVNGQNVPLATNTVKQIAQFTNDHYYTTPTTDGLSPTKLFTRIANLNPTGSAFIAQGGAPTSVGTGGTSGQPGTPFPNENFQQIAFTGTNQLAMANAGVSAAGTNDTQFFITASTLSPPNSLNTGLGYNYTIFGQQLSGQDILNKMIAVPTSSSNQPLHNISITAVSLSSTNPNGVLLLNTTQAMSGEMATITVTATDSITHTTTSQQFTVTVGDYNGTTSASMIQTINFRPFALAGTSTTPVNTPVTATLPGKNTFPDTTVTVPLTYKQVSQPAHGTVTNFNASTGTFTYTPDPGFKGTDSFKYEVSTNSPNNGQNGTINAGVATSNPGVMSILVGPTVTGAVTQVGTVLLVTPLPRYDHGTNKIEVAQTPSSAPEGSVIQVNINGTLDTTTPATSSLTRIIVFGGRDAKNDIVVDPSVTLPVTLDSGHGLKAYITGGSGPSREHGWLGYNELIGGPGPNWLIGLAGHVRFKANSATQYAFVGKPHRRTPDLHTVPPSGTFYLFVNGRLVPRSVVVKTDHERERNAHAK